MVSALVRQKFEPIDDKLFYHTVRETYPKEVKIVQ